MAATTGLGKSNFSIALGMRIAAGKDFLHWQGRRKASVMYVDGEMSKRLIKQRLAEEANRVGESPTGFYALCAEDLDEHRPLNSARARAPFLVLSTVSAGLISSFLTPSCACSPGA